MIMSESSEGLTPLGIAGTNYSDQTALIFLEFFKEHFHLIEKIFEN